MQRARKLNVVGPVGATEEQTLVFLTANRATNGAGGLGGFGVGGGGHFVPPISDAARATDFTMLW